MFAAVSVADGTGVGDPVSAALGAFDGRSCLTEFLSIHVGETVVGVLEGLAVIGLAVGSDLIGVIVAGASVSIQVGSQGTVKV